MDQVNAAIDAAWKVLLVGVLLGAGLPTLFAVGVRSLAWGQGDTAITPDGVTTTAKGNPMGTVLAYVLFAFVLTAIGLGITYIVAHGFGYSLVFDSIIPSLKKK